MTRTRAHSPAELIALLPYQFGYRPRRCAVVVCLGDGVVGLCARVDLPPPGQEETLWSALVSPLTREAPEAIMVVGFEDEEGESLPAVGALTELTRELGCQVIGPMVVRGEDWYPVDPDTGRVHWRGRALPAPADVPAVAAFVGRGIAPMESREALTALLEPQPGQADVVRAVAELAGRGGPSRDESVLAWQAVSGLVEEGIEVEDLPDGIVAAATLSVTDRTWRDAILARLCPGALTWEDIAPSVRRAVSEALPVRAATRADLESRGGLRSRLCALVRRVPEPVSADLLAIVGHLAWWEGDGTMARVACERAQEVAPGHTLTALLLRLLDHGVRPDRLVAQSG